MATQKCMVCRGVFKPDPRVGSKQKVCSQEICRKERKRRADARWRAANRGYRDQNKMRRWAAHYPRYWRAWRAGHPDYVERNRVQTRQRMQASRLLFAKQDAIRTDPVGYLESIRPPPVFAKQDEIGARLDGLVTFLAARLLFAKPNDMAFIPATVASSCPWTRNCGLKLNDSTGSRTAG